MQIAETVRVHVLCKLLRRWLGRTATHPYRSLLGLQACLNECLPQIRVALLIAQLAALLRWDASDETLCHQVLQVPAQRLFRYPDVLGNVCYLRRVRRDMSQYS